MKNVVVNSSPIIGLSMIGQLELLWSLFDEIRITQEVYDEIMAGDKGTYGKKELKKAIDANHIEIYDIHDKDLLIKLTGKLHKGEVSVIIAGNELEYDFVILDEIAARNLAEVFSLTPLGVIGILQLAKRKKLIKSIKSYLDQLRTKGFRISKKIYFEVLSRNNEEI